MKMMYTHFLLAAMLSSTTMASGTRRVQESTLGELFLTEARNVADTPPQMSFQKDGSIGAEFENSEDIAAVANDIRQLCTANGYIESENSYTDYVSIYCRLSSDDLDAAMAAMLDTVNAANPNSASSSTSVYNNGYGNPAAQEAVLRAMDMLLEKADTIEQVMLIVPYWSNFIYDNQTSDSSININLNKAYNDTHFNGGTFAPTGGFIDEEESLPNDNMNNNGRAVKKGKKKLFGQGF